MYMYIGQKIVDANGKVFEGNADEKDVVFPITVYQAPAKWVSLDFNIYEVTGPYEFDFKAKDLKEFEDKQSERW